MLELQLAWENNLNWELSTAVAIAWFYKWIKRIQPPSFRCMIFHTRSALFYDKTLFHRNFSLSLFSGKIAKTSIKKLRMNSICVIRSGMKGWERARKQKKEKTEWVRKGVRSHRRYESSKFFKLSQCVTRFVIDLPSNCSIFKWNGIFRGSFFLFLPLQISTRFHGCIRSATVSKLAVFSFKSYHHDFISTCERARKSTHTRTHS